MKLSFIRALFTLAFLLAAIPGICQDYTATQNKIKSLFLYSFIKNIEWPSHLQQKDFKVCILGDKEFSISLETLLSSKFKGDRKIVVEFTEPGADCRLCDLLFISEESNLAKVKTRDFTNPSLWITSGFYNQSFSDIALLYSDSKLQYSINKDLLDKTKFRVPAQMMLLANQKLITQ